MPGGLSCFNILALLLGSVALATSQEVAVLLASTSTSRALEFNVLIVMDAYKVTPLVGCSIWPAFSKMDLSCSGVLLYLMCKSISSNRALYWQSLSMVVSFSICKRVMSNCCFNCVPAKLPCCWKHSFFASLEGQSIVLFAL